MNTIRIPVDTGLTPFDHTDLGPFFYHFTANPDNDITYRGGGLRVTNAEHKLISEEFMRKVHANVEFEAYAQASSAEFLMKQGSPCSELEGFRASMFVQVYMGKGKPRVQDVHDYHRVRLPREPQASSTWRWTKIRFVHPTITEAAALEKEFDTMLSSVDEAERAYHSLAHFTTTLTKQKITLREIVEQSNDSSDQTRANCARQLLDAVMERIFCRGYDIETMVVHGNKFYDLNESTTKTVYGLKYCRGVSRTLSITPLHESPLSDIALSTQPCFKLFFPATCVAEIMNKFFGTRETYQDIAGSLRGLKVKIKGIAESEIRSIKRLELVLPSGVGDEQKHPAWRAKSNFKPIWPGLPCINVGSGSRDVLLPPELCMMLPMQSFNGPHHPDLERELLAHRNNNTTIIASSGSRINELLVVDKRPILAKSSLTERFAESFSHCTSGVPTVLYVEIGTTQSSGDGWDKVCSYVKSQLSPNDNGGEMIKIFLKYTPNKSQNSWKTQLQRFVAKYQRDKIETLLAIAIHPEQHRQQIYNTLKGLCDVELGLQTFFVNMDRLEEKLRLSPMNGIQKVGNELMRRMRVRNPPEKYAKNGRPGDTSLAMHIARLSTDAMDLDTYGRATSCHDHYLLVLVSREMETSERYKTTTQLLTAEKLVAFDPSSLVHEHIDHWQNPEDQNSKKHRLTIFRSGYMPPPLQEKTQQDQDVGRTLRASKQSNAARASPDTVAPLSPVDKARIADHEVLLLTEGTNAARKGPFELSYVLLEEDQSFFVDPSASGIIDAAIKNQAQGEKVDASLFIRDTHLANPSTVTLRAQRPFTAKDNPKTTTLTLLGKPLSYTGDEDNYDETEWVGKSVSAPESPSTHDGRFRDESPGTSPPVSLLRSRSRGSLGHAAESDKINGAAESELAFRQTSHHKLGDNVHFDTTRSASMPTYTQHQKTSSQATNASSGSLMRGSSPVAHKLRVSAVTKAEIARLSKAYHDEHLGLSGTKWPIPTYLAHGAAKRAMIHLRHTGWSEDGKAQFDLPKVPDNVARSLYYL